MAGLVPQVEFTRLAAFNSADLGQARGPMPSTSCLRHDRRGGGGFGSTISENAPSFQRTTAPMQQRRRAVSDCAPIIIGQFQNRPAEQFVIRLIQSVSGHARFADASHCRPCGAKRLHISMGHEQTNRPSQSRVCLSSLNRLRSASCQEALRDRIFAATYRLADLEAFELRMVEIERLVLAGVPMGKTECLRLGPGFERRLALPYRV